MKLLILLKFIAKGPEFWTLPLPLGKGPSYLNIPGFAFILFLILLVISFSLSQLYVMEM